MHRTRKQRCTSFGTLESHKRNASHFYQSKIAQEHPRAQIHSAILDVVFLPVDADFSFLGDEIITEQLFLHRQPLLLYILRQLSWKQIF